MRALLKTAHMAFVLSIAITWLFADTLACAQSLIVQHARIANLNSANVVSIHPYQPSGPRAAAAPQAAARPEAALAGASTGCASGSSQPAPIVTIVIALKCDPDLIYEYVYNNIEYEPLYGSNKGPLGTLLDRRGDDADQAILLVTLWNVAGYSQTGYANPGLLVSGTQIANLLNVQNNATAIEELLNGGGIPWGGASVNPDGSLDSIEILQFFAALNLSGTWYYFDPAFKSHTIVSGISSLASVLGYTRSQFLSDAGGTIGSVSITSVNRAALRADLTTYASNLVNYINQNNPTWSVGNVIGGKTIQPLTGSPIRETIPGFTPSSTFPTNCPIQTPSLPCRTSITITMPGASSAQAIQLYTDQVYGHRITVFSVPSGSNYVPTLLIDGAVPSCVGAGTCTNVGTAEPAGTTWSIPITVTEPNQSTGSGCTSGVTACKTLTIAAGGSYLISTGTGQVGRGMPQYHRQLLAQARAAGNADTSELVLGESLAVLGYTWLAEYSAEQQITDQLVGTTTLYQFGVGITGQTNINQFGYQGPYVDLPVNYLQVAAQVSNGPTTTIDGHTYPTAFVSAFFTDSEASSAFESAVLEQTQAPVSGMTAASTINIIDANMNPSYSGALQKTYFADGTTCAGQTAFVNTIEPAISPNYNTSDYNTIVSAVMAGSSNCPSNPPTGAQVLIPQSGKLAVGLWTGAGYTEILPQSNLITIGQLITGGMSGGFSGADIPDPTDNFQVTLPPPAATDTVTPILNTTPAPSNPPVAEPVDGITGAYIYTHNDLTTGSGRFPYALPFARTYLSSSGSYLTTTAADAGIGNGWAHTYSANAQVQSDPYIGMGTTDSPAISAATSIAALYVMQDLLSVTPTAQTMTISSMVARWFADQLTSNVVMVQQPNTTEEYVALPHGDGATNFAFNPPPGSSVRFTQVAGGQHTYQRKDAVTLNFGPAPAGALQGWTFPNGMSVNLRYSGSQLSTISNNIGRSLTLSYNGANVASVIDDTGRTVSYAYDGKQNLVGFTDPLGAVTAYAYDTSGSYDTFGHLTQIVYPFRPGKPTATPRISISPARAPNSSMQSATAMSPTRPIAARCCPTPMCSARATATCSTTRRSRTASSMSPRINMTGSTDSL
jgi:YD repeat-containing protein